MRSSLVVPATEVTVYHNPTLTSARCQECVQHHREVGLTKIDGDTEVIRNIVFSDGDNTLSRLPIPPLLRLVLCAPSPLSLIAISETEQIRSTGMLRLLRAHNVRVSVHGGELCRVRFGQREELASDGLEVERIVEEELEEDRWCREEVVGLRGERINSGAVLHSGWKVGGRSITHQIQIPFLLAFNPDQQPLISLQQPFFDHGLRASLVLLISASSTKSSASLTLHVTKKYGSYGIVTLNMLPSSWIK
jgi:hypothetical protein